MNAIDKIKAIIVLERPQMAVFALIPAAAGVIMASRGNVDGILTLKMSFFVLVFIMCSPPHK